MGVLAALVSIGLGVGAYLIRERRMSDVREEHARKLTPDAEEDATKPIEDEAYRFRIELPGPGWKLASAQALVKLNPDTLAGLIMSEGQRETWVMVLVEERPDVDLVAFASSAPENFGMVEPQVAAPKPSDFHGYAAMRVSASGSFNGRQADLSAVVFSRDGHVFSVIGYDMPATGDTSRIDAAIAAFTPTEGTVVGRPPPATPNEQGIGWRVTDGRFESAAYAFSLSPSKQCRVDGGEDANAGSTYAEVVVLCREPQMTATLMPFLAPGADHEAMLAFLNESAITGYEEREGSAAMRVPGVDAPVALRRGFAPENDDEVLGGAFRVSGDLYLQLLVAYPPSLRARVEGALDEMLTGLAPIPTATNDALAKQLSADASPPAADIGESYAYRAGSFVDFEHGMVWKRPPGTWRVRTSERAESTAAGAHLWFQEPSVELIGLLYVESDVTDPLVHAKYWHGDAPPPPEPLGAALRWGSPVDVRMSVRPLDNTVPSEQIVASAVLGTKGYAMTLEYPVAYRDEAQALSRQALERLDLVGTALAKTEEGLASYVDHRMGFKVKLPQGATVMKREELFDATEIMWRAGDEFIGVAAVTLGAGDTDTLRGIIIQSLTGQINSKTDKPPTRSPSNVGMRPDAERIRYELKGTMFDVHHLVHENVLYALIIGAKRGRAEELANGFVLLPAAGAKQVEP